MTKEEAIQKESERRYPLDSCTDLPHPFAYEKAEDILDKRVLFREGAKWAMEEYRGHRWVRASERGPSIRVRVPIKYNGEPMGGWLHEGGYWVTNHGHERDLTKIIWLDESPEPSKD